MKNATNNANRITRITVRFYPQDRAPMTFMQNLRELGAAFGIAFLFAGALQVTSLLLSLIAAGMAAQVVNFLNAGGLFTEFSYPVWNSAAFLSDSSTSGQILAVLIGYNAQPTLFQLLAYVGTLILIWLLTRIKKV
jgi:high-affinity Fe2+/Pb2+ permease